MDRRTWLLRASVGTLALLSASFVSRSSPAATISLEESSDPDGPIEKLNFDQTKVEELLSAPSKGEDKSPTLFAQKLLDISKDYVKDKINRDSEQGRIVDSFCRLFGLHLRDGKDYTHYCAAGLCFAACRAYCELSPPTGYSKTDPVPGLQAVLPDISRQYFRPNPGVRYIMWAAQEKKDKWITMKEPHEVKRGHLVIFSWRGDAVANHIGIVDRVPENGSLHTVEFNTSRDDDSNKSNGGAVATKERKMSDCTRLRSHLLKRITTSGLSPW